MRRINSELLCHPGHPSDCVILHPASYPPHFDYICPVDQIDSERRLALPAPFIRWFAEKGWQPRAHQLELLARAEAGESTLLIAPTGAGKTLAGFLPSLTDLTRRGKNPGRFGLHRHSHALHLAAKGAGRRYRA